MRPFGFALVVVCAALAGAAAPALPASVPSQFVVETIGSGFDTPTAIAFLPGGRMLVAEKRGHVYTLHNGVKSASPLWNRTSEVLNHHDRGLLGLAVDPNYASNRFIYLLYTVDPDSNGTDDNDDAFGRIVRYQVSATDSNVVNYASRAVLMGVSWRQGPLSASPSHTIGTLRFGSDGSLLASIGDGASYGEMDDGGLDPNAFGSGANKTSNYEDIGAFRAQSLTSLCGKILRIDPASGHGYPSNPYWDGTPTSIRSRVWAYGVRNPFRFGIRPGGSTNPADGDPGTVYIGDVGWTLWEDLNVVRTPGANFGWPCYEGFGQNGDYQDGNPAHNGCGSFGQPDNPASHAPPDAAWHHNTASQSVPPGVKGNAIVGGAFYTGTSYPAAYRGRFFFADYGQNWMRVATYDAGDNLVSISGFGTDMNQPVDIVTDPASGDLVYVSIGTGEVRRIRYTGTVTNLPPVAVATATPSAGLSPLVVGFSSAGSSDPDNDPVGGHAWQFGDGTFAAGPSPSHTYAQPGSYAAVLTVTDGRGGTGRDTVRVVALASNAFPTTPVLDDFDRPNGPIGGAWVGQTSTFRITGNALTQQPGYGSVVWNGAVFGPNQEAFVRLDAITATSNEHNLMLKVQGTAWNTGHVEVRYDAPLTRVSVGTYTPGVGWQSAGFIGPVTFAAGDRLGARALADGTVQVFKNGTLLGAHSVAYWPFAALGGRLGLTLDNAVSSRLDDFGGGDVPFTVNTPPQAIVLGPADHSFYAAGDTLWLHGDGSDAEDTPAELDYGWRVDLHHNNHVHPSSFVSDQKDDFLLGEDHDDGTGVFLVARLVVSDQGGLSDTASVALYPEINLRPADIQALPPQPFSGTPVEYRFALENTGRMASPLVHWTLHTETTVIAEGDTLVPASDRVEVTRLLTAPDVGLHTLRVVVDSTAQVVEQDENDNHAERELIVGGVSLDAGEVPHALALSLPHPNPSAGRSRLTLALPAAAPVGFDVFDLQGRAVWRAPLRRLGAGVWELAWAGALADGTPARPGIYLAVVTAGERSFVRRVARIR
jgi:glucose/arabinose dehydrogenase